MLLSRGYLRLVAKITYQNQGLGLERNVSGLLDDKPYDYQVGRYLEAWCIEPMQIRQ